jgi:hypothetical protein
MYVDVCTNIYEVVIYVLVTRFGRINERVNYWAVRAILLAVWFSE